MWNVLHRMPVFSVCQFSHNCSLHGRLMNAMRMWINCNALLNGGLAYHVSSMFHVISIFAWATWISVNRSTYVGPKVPITNAKFWWKIQVMSIYFVFSIRMIIIILPDGYFFHMRFLNKPQRCGILACIGVLILNWPRCLHFADVVNDFIRSYETIDCGSNAKAHGDGIACELLCGNL